MKTRIQLGFMLAALGVIPASGNGDPAERIVELALSQPETWRLLSHLTDRIGARPSGSVQAEQAVQWATQILKGWDLDVRNEAVSVPHWVRGIEEARVVSHSDQKLVLTTLGGSVATPPDGLTAEVVEVSSLDEVDALGESKIRGKIVLYNKAMNLELVKQRRAFEAYSEVVPMRGYGASRAAKHGALAALVRSVGSASLRTPHTGAMRYDPELPRIPAAAISSEDADLIHRLLEAGEKVRIFLRLTPQMLPDVQSANVIAEIRGREKPDEIVLVGGHLDSWDLGTGAIDNASGVSMVMETMRLIKLLDLKPKRTIRAVLFMNEEMGLRGASGYFEAHKNEKHFAAIEADAGAASPLGFVTTLDPAQIEALRPHLGVLEKTGATLLVSASETGADTSPLVGAGVVGFGLIPDPLHYFDYHHTAADTLDKIDRRELSLCAASVAALVWTLADLPVDSLKPDAPLKASGH